MSSLRGDAIGHLGQDAEMKYLQDATPVVSFSIGTNPYTKKGEQQKTNWVRCSFFGSRAEAVHQYLLKGTQVHVRGDLDVREFTSRDGSPGHSIDLRVSELDLLGSKQDGQAQSRPAAKPAAAALDDDSDDAIPF